MRLLSPRQVALFMVALAFSGSVSLGCGLRELARGEVQPPRVAFQELRIYPPRGDGWPLQAVLRLTNPNPQAIDLLGYDYELRLEGQPVAQGAGEEPVHLPAGGQTTAALPIWVKLPALTRLWPRLLSPDQRLHYQVTGGFRLASVLGGMLRVPFQFRGEFTPQEAGEALRPYLR